MVKLPSMPGMGVIACGSCWRPLQRLVGICLVFRARAVKALFALPNQASGEPRVAGVLGTTERQTHPQGIRGLEGQ